MRSQFFDGFNFNDKKYSLVAIEKPDELFNIKSLPLRPTVFDESCLRGYSTVYRLDEEKQLILSQLFTNNGNDEAPTLFGVEPVSFHSPAGNVRYDLERPVSYTGSFLIAYKFIHEFFTPFGYQLPHAFETVYELTFDNGVFTRVEDRSAAAARLRTEYEPPVNAKKRLQSKFGNIFKGKSEEFGFDDDIIAQYMDISYDTKYLF